MDEVLEENRRLKLGLQHFTKEEVCKLFRVSKFTLDVWEDRGILLPISIGKKRLYSGEMIINGIINWLLHRKKLTGYPVKPGS